MILASQLYSDDFRNVGQALLIPLICSQPIKHLRPDPGLRRLLLERISKIEIVEERRAQRVLESS